jgi:hypothetical protein
MPHKRRGTSDRFQLGALGVLWLLLIGGWIFWRRYHGVSSEPSHVVDGQRTADDCVSAAGAAQDSDGNLRLVSPPGLIGFETPRRPRPQEFSQF